MSLLGRLQLASIVAIISGAAAAVLQFCIFDNVWRNIATFCLTGVLAYAFTRRKLKRMGLSLDCTWMQFHTATRSRRRQ